VKLESKQHTQWRQKKTSQDEDCCCFSHQIACMWWMCFLSLYLFFSQLQFLTFTFLLAAHSKTMQPNPTETFFKGQLHFRSEKIKHEIRRSCEMSLSLTSAVPWVGCYCDWISSTIKTLFLSRFSSLTHHIYAIHLLFFIFTCLYIPLPAKWAHPLQVLSISQFQCSYLYPSSSTSITYVITIHQNMESSRKFKVVS